MAKSLAEKVNDDMSGPSEDGLGPEDYDHGMQDAAQSLIDAVKKGDAAGVSAAWQNLHSMAHKEWGDLPPEGGGADDSGKHDIPVIAVMSHGGK